MIAGGLTTSTLMTLVFLPAAYTIIEDLGESARRGWRTLGPRKRRDRG